MLSIEIIEKGIAFPELVNCTTGVGEEVEEPECTFSSSVAGGCGVREGGVVDDSEGCADAVVAACFAEVEGYAGHHCYCYSVFSC